MVMAVRAPIAGISMASSTVSPSAPSCNGGVITVRAPPFRTSFFGRGGNSEIWCCLFCVDGAVGANPFRH